MILQRQKNPKPPNIVIAISTQQKSANIVQNNKDSSGKCSDKGMCKCIGGTYHNGLSKVFGNSGNSLVVLTASKSISTFANDVVEPALSNLLKRPPKA